MVYAGLVFDGGGELKLQAGKLEKYIGKGNLRDFYKELHQFLVKNGFKDNWRVGHQAKAGEWANGPGNMNRSGDMFEIEFMSMDKGDRREMEIRWEAKAHVHESEHGSFYFKLDMVCRNMIDRETLVDGKKKVEQEGAWEFRNAFIYRNSAVKDYLGTLPIIKNSESLQKFFFEFFYETQVDNDIKQCMGHYVGHINGIIKKYFG